MLCLIVIGPQFQHFTLKRCFLTVRSVKENVDGGGGDVFFDFSILIFFGDCSARGAKLADYFEE